VGESIQGEEGIVYAELDLEDCVEPKQFHDTVGYYQRFDIFDLKVDRRRQGVEDMFVDDVRAIKDEDSAVSVVEDEDEAADKLG
jgi:nitrilase